MSFLEPDRLLLLLAVLPVALVVASLWGRRLRATAAWASHGLWGRLLPGYRRSRLLATTGLLVLALSAAVMGLARPAWGTEEEEIERRGLDVALIIDTSLSMTAIDVAPSRLEIAKALLDDLLASLVGHRVALVQFEGAAQVLSPLTTDRGMVGLLLESLEAGSMPTPGSNLTTGLAAGLRLLPVEDGGGRPIMVLVSDGEDHGEGSWQSALRPLRDAGAVVHTVGVGTPGGSPLPRPDGPGGFFHLDDQGRQVISRLEPEALEQLARATGGVYREVRDARTHLAPIAEAILEVEGGLQETETVVKSRERFQWFLGAAAAFLALHLAIGPFRGQRRALR